MKPLFSCLAALMILSGCKDKSTTVTFYTKTQEKPKCLKLTVTPPDFLLSQTLKKLYVFSNTCPFELRASKKSSLCCNSNQNADKKALSNFPTGYIRLDVYKNKKIFYSYYKDLNEKSIKKEDIKEAFARVRKDLL